MQSLKAPKWLLTISLLSIAAVSFSAYAEDAQDSYSVKSDKPHNVLLLNHGLASLEERLQMIERAETSIDVEYFIYRTDKSAKLFTQALVKKARQGVKVRMLLDYFLVKGDLSPFYAHELEKEGIEVKYFNTTATLNLFSGQYRNHRKVLLVDGKEAITGGRNIGDEYFDLSEEYNFLDREVRLEGELVHSIEATFNAIFSTPKSERMNRQALPKFTDAKYRRDRGTMDTAMFRSDLKNWNKKVAQAVSFINDSMEAELESSIRAKGTEELSSEYHGVCDQMSFHSEYPTIGKTNRKTARVIKHYIFDRIKNSEKTIMMDSPYFIVNNELADFLNDALSRKVNVKLLTNSLNSTDAIYVYAAFDSIAKKWLEKGLDSYIFKGKKPDNYGAIDEEVSKARFGVHAKTFIFDDKDVVIGTYNVDPRSANFNSEMIVSCDNNPEMAAAVQKDIDSRLEGSIHLDSHKKIDEAEFYQTGFGKKMIYFLLKFPANLFGYLL